MFRKNVLALAAGLAILFAATTAKAADVVRFATAGSHAFDASIVEHGKALGYFDEVGIDVSFATTENSGLNLQAIIAGSADIGVVPVPSLLAAGIQGAPVKMISTSFKGTSDFLWYARSDSPLKSFKDVTEKNTIGVPNVGSASYIFLLALLDQYGVKATVIPYGTSAAGMTQVMTKQIDAATDGNGLLGVPEFGRGEVKPLAYGRELEAMRDVTVRGLVVSTDTLAKRRDVLIRFLKAYQKSVDWKYSDPKALEWFARDTQSSLEEAKRVQGALYPQGVMSLGDVTGIDFTVQQSLAFKRISRAPTAEELSRMFETVWRPGT